MVFLYQRQSYLFAYYITHMAKEVFVNLCVKNLNASIEFFKKLGFSFNAQFTNENGACMIIEDGYNYAMLLPENFYKTFTKKEIIDANKSIEVLIAVSFDSNDEVNKVADAALANG